MLSDDGDYLSEMTNDTELSYWNGGWNEDFGARQKYLRQEYVIASHRILCDTITYPCLYC